MTEKRYNTYCDQNENRTVIDDDLNNNHIFIAYCGELEDAIRLKIALNSVTDELNRLHEENIALKERLYQQEVSEQRRKEYDDFWNEKISHHTYVKVKYHD